MLYRKQTTENLSVSDVSCILNTEALVQQIVTAKLQGTDSGALAYLFHRTLAEQIVAACKAAREDSGRAKVALSGGVFQNRLLLRLTEEGLEQEAAQRERAAEDYREADARQADAPENGLRHEVTAQCDRTDGDIGIKNKKKHEKKACEYDRIPPRASSVFPLEFTHPRFLYCI